MDIHVNCLEEDVHVGTFGGEHHHYDYSMEDYGITIEELSISGLTPKHFKELAVTMINHLMINGHRFEFKECGSYPEEFVSVDN